MVVGGGGYGDGMSPYWGTLCTPPHTSLPLYIRGERHRECHRDDVHCGHMCTPYTPPYTGWCIRGLATDHDSVMGISHNVYTPPGHTPPYGYVCTPMGCISSPYPPRCGGLCGLYVVYTSMYTLICSPHVVSPGDGTPAHGDVQMGWLVLSWLARYPGMCTCTWGRPDVSSVEYSLYTPYPHIPLCGGLHVDVCAHNRV